MTTAYSFYKALDFPLKEIKQLLDGNIDRENTLIKQGDLLEQKNNQFKELVNTINFSVKNTKEEIVLDMTSIFKSFKTEEGWQEALKGQNENLKKEYDFDLMNQTIDVESMNDSATEAKSFNEYVIKFLQEGFSANDSKVFEWVKKHLSFLTKRGRPSTPHDFLNQTELYIVDDFHRNMFEQWQVAYTYFFNKVASNYLSNQQ
ncbi:TipAS antibiotic-recognition domain-containing protein [Bacillus thuringiensis]|uniref:TipAS antibiotic-recognition domain-containing protein n=1 Tax=Bacillus thuringiensis TaxID=1428 RepID=UPI000B43682C|nr:TipAS antibiotic-recognition domain-containing protein [Bacillus thuringiensis]